MNAVESQGARGLAPAARRRFGAARPSRRRLRDEAEAIAEEARARAPGELGGTVEIIDQSRGMKPAYAIGTAQPAGRFIEFGTSAPPRDALALAGFPRPFTGR